MNHSQSEVYIYVLKCPKTCVVKYVGRTRNYQARIAGHINSKTSTPVSLWIQGLRQQGLEPISRIVRTVTAKDACKYETAFICRYKGPELLNINEGSKMYYDDEPMTGEKNPENSLACDNGCGYEPNKQGQLRPSESGGDKMSDRPNQKISVPMQQADIEALQRYAKEDGRTLASYVRQVIDMHIQEAK